MCGSREISLVSSLHRASTDALISLSFFQHRIYDNVVVKKFHASAH